MSFNSRTREGCDQAPVQSISVGGTFQFTHPGGVRPTGSGDPLPRLPSFNSRTREGCDCCVDTTGISSPPFQFTHPGGVRHPGAGSLIVATLFQFTHPGGVRLA